MSPVGVAPEPGEEREGVDRIEEVDNVEGQRHIVPVMPLFL